MYMRDIVDVETDPFVKAFGADDVAEEDLLTPCESGHVASDLLT